MHKATSVAFSFVLNKSALYNHFVFLPKVSSRWCVMGYAERDVTCRIETKKSRRPCRLRSRINLIGDARVGEATPERLGVTREAWYLGLTARAVIVITK